MTDETETNAQKDDDRITALPGKCEYIIPSNDKPCEHYMPSNVSGEAGLCKLGKYFRCPEAIRNKCIRLSHSTIQDFLRCKRLFWYHNIKGLTLKPDRVSSAIKQGSLWDILKDYLYSEAIAKRDNTITDEFHEEWVKKVRDYITSHKMNPYDVARVRAVYRAYKDLIDPELDGLVGSQVEFNYHRWDSINGDVTVRGFYDRLYTASFHEDKFTSDEKYYNNVWAIRPQAGTYFLANDKLEKCTMKIIQKPGQKVKKESKTQVEKETDREYEDRIYSDILKSPSNVFIGYNRERRWYGIDFYRGEFNLKELEARYKFILQEIVDSETRNSYYCNEKNCFMYNTMCDYINVCRSNGYVSDEIFELRKRNE